MAQPAVAWSQGVLSAAESETFRLEGLDAAPKTRGRARGPPSNTAFVLRDYQLLPEALQPPPFVLSHERVVPPLALTIW